MKRIALTKCPTCNAVANPRWPSCLACGEVLPSLKALAHKVLERNGSRVSIQKPANDPSDRWDDEMQKLTQWFIEADRPQVRRFELCPGVVVLDSESELFDAAQVKPGGCVGLPAAHLAREWMAAFEKRKKN